MEFIDLDSRTIEHICLFLDEKSIFKLAITSRKVNDIISSSTSIWQAKLKQDFDLSIIFTPNLEIKNELYKLTRALYNHRYKFHRVLVPFKGLFTNGGIDSNVSRYWIQNLFQSVDEDTLHSNPQNQLLGSPYCSNCSSNADIIAVLLPGWADSPDTRVFGYKQFMARRLASIFYHTRHLAQNPFLVGARAESIEDTIVQARKMNYEQVKDLFLSVTAIVEEDGFNGGMGRAIFDNSEEDNEERRLKVLEVGAEVRAGKDQIYTQIVHPQNENIVMDGSIVEHLRRINSHGSGRALSEQGEGGSTERLENNHHQQQQQAMAAKEADRMFALMRTIDIGRKGALTCPVQSGVLYSGIVDFKQLARKVEQQGHGSNEKLFNSLQGMTQSSTVAVFKTLKHEDEVIEMVKHRVLPSIISHRLTPSGLIIEFGYKGDGISTEYCDAALEKLEKVLEEFRAYECEDLGDDDDDDGEGEEEAREGRRRETMDESPNAKKIDKIVEEEDDDDNKRAAIVEWKPVVWYRFFRKREMVRRLTQLVTHFGETDIAQTFPVVLPDGTMREQQIIDHYQVDIDNAPSGGGAVVAKDELCNYKLVRPRVSNAVLVKFINQENRMNRMNDDHEWPNIDATHVHIYGQCMRVGEWGSVAICDGEGN
jgi:hypothetical protein